jgi:putative transposase
LAIPSHGGTKASVPQRAFIEALDGLFRVECPITHWFPTLADAPEKLEAWRSYYNKDRPPGAIGNKPASALTNPGGITGPPTR